MNTTLKRYLLSSLTTFIGAFCGVIALQLQSTNGVQLTSTIILSIIAVAGRAAIKAVVESFASQNGDLPTNAPTQQ